MKVALICHFSNQEVRSYMSLDYKRRLFYLINNLLGRKIDKNKTYIYSDVSPWVSMIINELRTKENIQLVVISAHTGLKRLAASFEVNSVKYYFFNTDFSLFLKRVVHSPRLWQILEPNSKVVKKIIKKEKPDVINLIGSDGAYFSSTVLGINKIPILVTLQTVYTNPDRYKHSTVDPFNWYIEEKVFNKEKYYACSGKMHYDLLIEKNPDVIALRFAFPHNDPRDIENAVNIKQQYEFVTFAQNCCTSKGTFDALEAFVIVHKKYPRTRLNICGMRDNNAEALMKSIIERNNIQDFVFFTDFFEKQEDLFKHLKKSRFAVLPVKLDVIPGTVTQAMALGLPVVTNATTGTPRLNDEKQCVLLCQIDNIQELADNMLLLYENSELAERLKQNAIEYTNKMMTNKQKVNLLVEDLYAVYQNSRNGVPIPDTLLFR